jgi:drug/metabolite transporter (DMT)-like permease
MTQSKPLGLTTLILFVFSNAMMMNYITYKQNVDLEPVVLASVASLASIIIALPLFLFNRSPPLTAVSSKRLIKPYLWITLFTFTCWTSGYTALLNLNPAAVAAIALAVSALIMALTDVLKLGRLGVVGSMLALGTVWVLSTSYSSVIQGAGIHDDYELEIGVTFSIACGISLYFIALLSKRLNDLGQSFHKIQVRRSLFAFLVCTTIGLLDGALATIVSEAPQLAALTVLFLILMQSALVLSIRTISRPILTVGFAGTALYTLIAQLAFFQQSVDSLMVITILGNALGVVLMSFVQTKSNLTCQR